MSSVREISPPHGSNVKDLGDFIKNPCRNPKDNNLFSIGTDFTYQYSFHPRRNRLRVLARSQLVLGLPGARGCPCRRQLKVRKQSKWHETSSGRYPFVVFVAIWAPLENHHPIRLCITVTATATLTTSSTHCWSPCPSTSLSHNLAILRSLPRSDSHRPKTSPRPSTNSILTLNL